ncbi:hypothetical protein [Cytophaga hutchinsonii]|uniref:DUF4468 domain-containing protein n=1 Tax=Cytophaga hutchinsonii (strain ATCC 33406 / DSM 1761 / CIP 103989 / NBRC 15051 / NCIMB 9469 / D465) TaxID=269798 RepID=A0A6N4SUN7_CYTH3|nr:hypothetical protein [Cytophaga hutchinsonii]ABG60104.1 hypothetical protein CHU_2856 [Cytophaga hutchinsonii ATCC 33406]SFX24086.1 hypothetical protein SAMN04487930_102198 [Cytophaga hutchinsonii ATCC 33406]
MKSYFLLFCLLGVSFISVAKKPIPPLDSTGKDYGYYFDVPFKKAVSWDSTLILAKRFFDSCYFEKYKMVGVDTATHSFKVRVTSKLKTHGMLKNTHKPVYSNCYMTFDYLFYYSETGLKCKVKRLVHYYTLNSESGYMGTTNGKKTMRTESERVEVPMIQTDVKLYTQKVLQEAHETITKSIEKVKAYKWNRTFTPKEKSKKSLEDNDY